MSSNILKMIACMTMLCDHIGYCLQSTSYGSISPHIGSVLRLIGRISFPIFAFLIAEGFKKTHNVVLYAGRLILAGIISEIPFNLCFYGEIKYTPTLNVMFSLATALLALVFADMCIKSSRKEVRFLFVVPVFAACYLANTSGMDYGYWGIILIFLFYSVDTNSIQKKLILIPVTLLFAARRIIEATIRGQTADEWGKKQLFSLLALIPLMLYNGKIGSSGGTKSVRKIKQYLFYLFYPAHLLILWAVFSNLDKITALF